MIFPDDKIRIIIDSMQIEEKPIQFNEEIFHRTIYEYKSQHPGVLDEFYFSTSGSYPYSELLERVLSRAKISRTLKTVNPDFADVLVRSNTHKYISDTIEGKFLEEKAEPELLALREIGCHIKQRMICKC